MIVRKIIIRFCKNIESFVIKSILIRAGGIFVLCRVEFSKIGKRNVTFIREMRVEHFVYISSSEWQNKNKKQFVYTTCSELGIFMY